MQDRRLAIMGLALNCLGILAITIPFARRTRPSMLAFSFGNPHRELVRQHNNPSVWMLSLRGIVAKGADSVYDVPQVFFKQHSLKFLSEDPSTQPSTKFAGGQHVGAWDKGSDAQYRGPLTVFANGKGSVRF
jgi:hypothetical protein